MSRHWPYRWMQLWHPSSPGSRVVVRVPWPRYLWTKGLDQAGTPQAFATLTETLRMYRETPPSRQAPTDPIE